MFHYSSFQSYTESRKSKTSALCHVCQAHDRTPKPLSVRRHGRNEKFALRPYHEGRARWPVYSSFFLAAAMSSRSPTPDGPHEVEVVQVILAFHSQNPSTKNNSSKGSKKAAASKGKVETKTKEISFTFEPLEETTSLSFRNCWRRMVRADTPQSRFTHGSVSRSRWGRKRKPTLSYLFII